MKNFIFAVVSAMALVGCGADTCAKAEECAKKAGDAFSITECRATDQADREKANTQGCLTQYNEASACVAGLQCGSNLEQISANCGGKLNLYLKCVQ